MGGDNRVRSVPIDVAHVVAPAGMVQKAASSSKYIATYESSTQP